MICEYQRFISAIQSNDLHIIKTSKHHTMMKLLVTIVIMQLIESMLERIIFLIAMVKFKNELSQIKLAKGQPKSLSINYFMLLLCLLSNQLSVNLENESQNHDLHFICEELESKMPL